ncbi:MAG: hypothetical protein WBP41_06955 [Saprospiraceae bacterium]
MLRYFALVLLISSFECRQPIRSVRMKTESIPNISGSGALLLTRFKSLEELKKVIQIEYGATVPFSTGAITPQPYVRLTFRNRDKEVTSILQSGINELDFRVARDGHFWNRMILGLRCPYAAWHRNDLSGIERLGRRRPWVYGKGDVAFYDIAETMVHNISDSDVMYMPSEDLSEKGYLNTFNHITAQAFMTSIFSESIADFVADVHERQHTELMNGRFTVDQLSDLEDGPIDNYVDLINNEWGQELGKVLRHKYSICQRMYWTPEIMTDYLNDIQAYYSWAFQIGFKPFRENDEIVIRFAGKINTINLETRK